MTLRALALAALVPAALASAAPAPETGSFVIQLGADTTSVESYVRTPARLEVTQVGRAPRVLRRQFVYEYASGAAKSFSMVVGPPGSSTPTQTVKTTFDPDSMRTQIQTGTAAPTTSALFAPPGTVVVPGSSPWASYEGEIMKLIASKRDTVRTTMYWVGGPTYWLSLKRLGRDSVRIANGHLDVYDCRVDKSGYILGARPVAGTARVTVTRVVKLDLDALGASYAAREQAGAGIGVLSPRDTVRATAAGAELWVDYGRPGRRGRTIYGNVVPYGEVWRTGANAATQFKTDKALDFGGGVVVPPGFYSLWTLPTESGWKLIVNRATGIWGTDHKAENDLYTIPMRLSALPEPVERFTIGVEANATGGVLNLDWDTTRASAAFTVQP